jgi:N-acetyl-alpha-D-muramate 1-phosphate uridylyltransferase
MIRTAMLLAAGLGTRMRPLTDDRPKPLVEVAGRTLIDRALDKLVAQGVTRAVVNVHYFADRMTAHLGQRTDLEIVISDERELLLETGGGVLKALPLLGPDPFFVVNTDATWVTAGDTTFERLSEEWNPATMDALLLLAEMDRSMGFDGPGDFFRSDSGRLERRGDRPSAPYVYAGAYVQSPEALQRYRVEKLSANVYWNDFIRAKRFFGTVMTPFWMHVGDPGARDEAEARLQAMGPGA